jgi:hypothetical protein
LIWYWINWIIGLSSVGLNEMYCSTIYTEDREMLYIGNTSLDYYFIHPISPEFQVVSNIVQKSFVQYDSCKVF